MDLVARLRSIKTFFTQLNRFESVDTRSNPYHLRTAIIATRLYIILMASIVFILVLFTALSTRTRTITIQNPSEEIFHQLYSKYSTTLHCPCSRIEIPYKTFINISYTFHPVCSSVFISNDWINLLFRPDMGYFYPFDFRSSASGQFQLLASLCLFANRSIEDVTDDFLSNALLTSEILSLSSLTAQSKARSEFLKTSATYTFRRLLNLVRDTTQMNNLQPAMQTAKMHVIHIYPDQSIDAFPFETIWPGTDDGECFCGVTSNCYASSAFFDLWAEETEGAFFPPVDPTGFVTGFQVGCYALDGLLHSSLQCFFDSTCLANVLTYFPMNNISILDINQTRYSPETSIETLVNNLFIEQWSSKSSFSAYYSSCAPILCTYKLTEHNSILQILTTLLGIYGGLSVVLRNCVSVLIRFWRKRKLRRPIRSDRPITYVQRVQNAQRFIKIQFIKLNFFKTPTTRTDPYELKTALISTRVYLLVLLFTLSIIIVYLLSSVRTHTITIEKPTGIIFEDLHEKYISTLHCPCSRLAIPYESFTSLSPVFHPVCSSSYISYTWIVAISGLNVVDSIFDAIDFRTAGPSFFNALATLCSLSNLTVTNAWYVFGQIPLITDSLLTKSEFQDRTNVAFEQFQNRTIIELQDILSLIELHTRTLYTSSYENTYLYTDTLTSTTMPIDFGWMPLITDTCSCGLSDQCDDVMSFFRYTDNTIYSPYYLKFTLPDILISCYVVSSVLRSSLDCFFNQTCLDAVLYETKSRRSMNITILNRNSTRFSSRTLIGTILNSLMIETWNEKIDYDKYFEQCAPEQCTYTYTSSLNFLEILTKVFALFGGLSVVLKMTIPFIVRRIRNYVRSRREPRVTTELVSNTRRVINIWRTLKSKLLELNMFESALTWDDDRQRQKEIQATRLYSLLLIIAVIILIIYTFIDTQTNIVKIPYPSQEQFEQLQLHSEYSVTLDCPCTNILIPYQSFISITPQYHQFCSSDFITKNATWFTLLYSSTAGMNYSYNDYRLFVVPHFRLLVSLCALANKTITQSILQFSTNIMTNERVQSRDIIEIQASTLLNQFLRSTPRTFVRTLDFIRYIAQGNGIVSSIFSNWHFLLWNLEIECPALWAVPYSYANNSCSCGTNSMCISPASFEGLTVPAFYIGCYPLESLLQSTLECLYNISCIDQLKSMYIQSNITFNALNASLSSPSMTVQSLVDTLFVEQWYTNVTYEQYYTKCAPLSCTYTFDGQINIIYTVTIIIGLYGGLSVALKLITPIFIYIGYYIVAYRRRRIEPVVAVITIQQMNGH